MPEVQGLSKVAQDADFLRQVPFRQFEFQTVTFAAANTDTFLAFQTLRPDTPENVRWLDISPSSVYTSTETLDLPPTYSDASPGWPFIYRSGGPNRPEATPAGIWLRCSRAPYTTRLLLFVERA